MLVDIVKKTVLDAAPQETGLAYELNMYLAGFELSSKWNAVHKPHKVEIEGSMFLLLIALTL